MQMRIAALWCDVLFVRPDSIAVPVPLVDAQQIERSELESKISLDGPISSISTRKVHLRKLSLDLIDLTTQVLNIAGQSSHLVELPPLVRICNHFRDEELLFFQDNKSLSKFFLFRLEGRDCCGAGTACSATAWAGSAV